jgi:hypothetical protein
MLAAYGIMAKAAARQRKSALSAAKIGVAALAASRRVAASEQTSATNGMA